MIKFNVWGLTFTVEGALVKGEEELPVRILNLLITWGEVSGELPAYCADRTGESALYLKSIIRGLEIVTDLERRQRARAFDPDVVYSRKGGTYDGSE